MTCLAHMPVADAESTQHSACTYHARCPLRMPDKARHSKAEATPLVPTAQTGAEANAQSSGLLCAGPKILVIASLCSGVNVAGKITSTFT
mmetsp:Transcript_32267/g.57046  ORF Transcript_32267/g.57046 Transcript_32267/m.57046 type:complete len:90 (+) Transcript_32267:352-621(+)